MNDILEALKYVNITVIQERGYYPALLFTHPKGFNKFREVMEGYR